MHQPAFPTPYLATSTILSVFRAHGILLQKTFGDNLQASYDGISTVALGVHVVGLIVYPPQKQGGLIQRGGAGTPVVLANVDIWIVPGLPERFRAAAEAAITKLTTDCHCQNSSFSLLESMVTVRSGEWGGERWTLRGADLPDHEYCVELTPAISPAGRAVNCGTLYGLGPAKTYFPQNMSVGIGQGQLLPDSVFGVVVSTATKVEITFTNGTTETVPTIPPPRALRTGLLDFYIAHRPCGTTYETIVGRTASGKIVARAKRLPGPIRPGATRRLLNLSP